MSDQERDRPTAQEAEHLLRVQDDAARLGLAVIGEATAMSTGDDAVVQASEDNLRETVQALVDTPLTARQEEVIETLGAMSGSITAGLGSALAEAQGREPEDVLRGAAASIVWQQRIATGQIGTGAADPEDPEPSAR